MSIINKSAVSLQILASRSLQVSGLINTATRRSYGIQNPQCYDIVVIGGGIVGAASARELILRHPQLKIAIAEKENRGVKNGVKDIKLLDSKEMRELVPNCKGLEALWSPHTDTVAILTGCSEEPKIIPFRDPRFPFLGVHLTPKIDGRIIVGPNAILAFCKEGYRWGDINMKELTDIVSFSGFRKMALKYAGFGLKEMSRSLFIPLQVMQIQKYIQDITSADVERGPAGVRAQAMAKDGTLIEDFVFDSKPGFGAIGSRVLHCRNAPSPGATSSLAIAKMIADKMKDEFKL
ncbi:unnamed protein product, partial [Iphiclides podalirius]